MFAPTIVFFAFSGALQICGFHEASGGEPPSVWIAKLAQVHKDQSIADRPDRKPAASAPVAAPPPPRATEARAQPHRSSMLVLWFFLMSIALILSTGLGVYMAFAYKRDRKVIVLLLGLGTVIPIASLFL